MLRYGVVIWRKMKPLQYSFSRQFSLAQNKSRRFQTRALAAAEVVTLDFNVAELWVGNSSMFSEQLWRVIFRYQPEGTTSNLARIAPKHKALWGTKCHTFLIKEILISKSASRWFVSTVNHCIVIILSKVFVILNHRNAHKSGRKIPLFCNVC